MLLGNIKHKYKDSGLDLTKLLQTKLRKYTSIIKKKLDFFNFVYKLSNKTDMNCKHAINQLHNRNRFSST